MFGLVKFQDELTPPFKASTLSIRAVRIGTSRFIHPLSLKEWLHAALLASLISGTCIMSNAHAKTDCFGEIENLPPQPDHLVEMRRAICAKLRAIRSPAERAFEQAIQRKWQTQHQHCGDEMCQEQIYTARIRELQHEPLNEQDQFSGDYRFGTPKVYQGRAYVVMLTNDRFRYFLEISTGAPNWHSGETSGEAKLRGNAAQTIRYKDNCLLSFKFAGSQASTHERPSQPNKYSCMTGQGIWFEQKFRKVEHKSSSDSDRVQTTPDRLE